MTKSQKAADGLEATPKELAAKLREALDKWNVETGEDENGNSFIVGKTIVLEVIAALEAKDGLAEVKRKVEQLLVCETPLFGGRDWISKKAVLAIFREAQKEDEV